MLESLGLEKVGAALKVNLPVEESIVNKSLSLPPFNSYIKTSPAAAAVVLMSESFEIPFLPLLEKILTVKLFTTKAFGSSVIFITIASSALVLVPSETVTPKEYEDFVS